MFPPLAVSHNVFVVPVSVNIRLTNLIEVNSLQKKLLTLVFFVLLFLPVMIMSRSNQALTTASPPSAGLTCLTVQSLITAGRRLCDLNCLLCLGTL